MTEGPSAPASTPAPAPAPAPAFVPGPEPGADPSLPTLAVSACLAGCNCTYKGGNHLHPHLDELRKRYRLVLVCPETQGGLPCPRPPAEIRGDRVVLSTGRDVTAEFAEGARLAALTAAEHGCEIALLKEKSPSCGFGRVYDGTFTGVLTEGDGWGAARLAQAGVRIVGDTHAEELLG